VGIIFFVLTRVRFLTHRALQFLIIVAGLIFLEGDMRWFQMSQKHASWNEILAAFDMDASDDLACTPRTYAGIACNSRVFLLFLAIAAFPGRA